MRYAKILVSIATTCSLALVHVPAVSADEMDAGDEVVVPAPAPPPPPKEEPKPKPKRDLRGLYGGPGVGVADHDGSTEAAWRMDVWLRVMNYFSIEVGYADLNDPGTGDVDGFTFSGVPQLPLGDIYTLYAKVGGMVATINNDTETDVTYGVGAAVELPYSLGVRTEWTHYDFSDDIDAFWVQLFYHFGGFK